MRGTTTNPTGSAMTKATAKPRNHRPTKPPSSPVLTTVIAKDMATDMHSETSTEVTIPARFLLSFIPMIFPVTTGSGVNLCC